MESRNRSRPSQCGSSGRWWSCVGVGDGEDVGDAERLADVALALHLAHVQRVEPDAVGRGAEPLDAVGSAAAGAVDWRCAHEVIGPPVGVGRSASSVSSRWSSSVRGVRAGSAPSALRARSRASTSSRSARAPGLAGHQRGDQAEQAVEAEQDGRADPAGADVERGRDQRGEPGDDRGDLVGQRGAGGAGVGVEQLGEPGALHPGQRVLADRVADDERDDDQRPRSRC